MGDRIVNAYVDVAFKSMALRKAMLFWLKNTPDYVAMWNENIQGEYSFLSHSLFEELKKVKGAIQADELSECLCEILTDKKIVGYWYEGTLCWLRDLAEFIEGQMELTNESGEDAKLTFEDGKCTISISHKEWSEEEEIDDFGKIPVLPPKENLRRAL